MKMRPYVVPRLVASSERVSRENRIAGEESLKVILAKLPLSQETNE